MRISKKLLSFGLPLAIALPIMLGGCDDPRSSTAPSVNASTVGNKIDDTMITTRVKGALLADPDVKSFDLKVETRQGIVQLSGFVDNDAQVDKASVIARGVEGVTGVEKNITIKQGTESVGNTIDDSFITTQVKTLLLADPNVKSADIAVATRQGKVQLSGFVNSQSQIDNAVAIAKKIEGVKAVANEMAIKK